MVNVSKEQYIELANSIGIEPALLMAFVQVESSGSGFDANTGKIIIQFEPTWFKKLSKLAQGLWSSNKVEGQAKEWEAFNDAYAKNPNKAMESTSIGCMQVMGLHWKALGFDSVGAMWDYAKKGDYEQVDIGVRFIRQKPPLLKALREKNFDNIALYYNGEQYKKYNYHNRIMLAYTVCKKMF